MVAEATDKISTVLGLLEPFTANMVQSALTATLSIAETVSWGRASSVVCSRLKLRSDVDDSCHTV